jgi:nitroreductase
MFDETVQIDDATVTRILESAISAPSAGNRQCWHFIVVRDEILRQRLAIEAGHQLFIAKAPVVIVVCADMENAAGGYGARGSALYCIQETAAAIENMLLTVVSLGLGSCWIGAFNEAVASEILELPENLRPVAMLPIGALGEVSKRIPTRKSINEIATFK